MVAIFKYAMGLRFVAISESKETAKKALYEEFLKENLKQYQRFPFNCQTIEELREYYPIERWWKNAMHCYEIEEVKII